MALSDLEKRKRTNFQEKRYADARANMAKTVWSLLNSGHPKFKESFAADRFDLTFSEFCLE